MANLLAIAELAWKQLFPNPSDETKVSREQFVATAKAEFAYQMWVKSKNDKHTEGQFDIPSWLLSEVTLPVANDEIDISGLNILRSLDNDTWLRDIGGLSCTCKYIKSTLDMEKLMCEDDSLGDARTYVVVKSKIKFPKGTHAKELPIIYANNGDKVDEKTIIIDDAVAGVVRRALIEIYGGKTGVEDKTNNSSSES